MKCAAVVVKREANAWQQQRQFHRAVYEKEPQQFQADRDNMDQRTKEALERQHEAEAQRVNAGNYVGSTSEQQRAADYR